MGRLPADLSPATQMNTGENSVNSKVLREFLFELRVINRQEVDPCMSALKLTIHQATCCTQHYEF